MTLLLNKGADPNIGPPALHAAVQISRNVKLIELLLDHSADPDLFIMKNDKPTFTALHLAAMYCGKHTIKTVWNKSKNHNAKDCLGRTAKEIILMRNIPDVILDLMSIMDNVSTKDLEFAMRCCCSADVLTSLDEKCKPDVEDLQNIYR